MNWTIKPEWPAPPSINAYTTLRTGGVSFRPYDSFNLATHVGDDPQLVAQNRAKLNEILSLPNDPIWIQQTHSTITLEATPATENKEADASFTYQPNTVCIVLTADCLPILFCNRQGTYVAAIHAGWRGLANGIIESALKSISFPLEDLLVWLGPGIGPTAFEVGNDVRTLFIQHQAEATSAFLPHNNRWRANLYELAKLRLAQQGVTAVFGGDLCTFSDANRFFSYRRDGEKTGRMATLIWRTDSSSLT